MDSATPIRLRSLVRTCEACPAQWEGVTEGGQAVYVRYRYGFLSVGIAATLDDAVGGGHYDEQIGDEWDGYLDEPEMLRLTGMIAP